MRTQLIALATAPLFAASLASAQTVLYEVDYDGDSDGATYGYAYADGGGAAFTNEVGAFGVNGSGANRISADFTGVMANPGFFGFGGGDDRVVDDSLTLLAPDSLGDYQASADVQILGATAATAPIAAELQFLDVNGTRAAVTAFSNYDVSAGGFQTLTFDYSGASFLGADGNRDTTTLAGLQDLINDGVINRLNINFNLTEAGGYGLDADNSLTLDNLSVVGPGVIPEPTAAALLGLGGLGLLARRRRR